MQWLASLACRRWNWLCCLLLPLGLAQTQDSSADALITEGSRETLRSIPLGRGLPVAVASSVTFLALESIEENAGSFRAVIDVRLLWRDDRLAFDPKLAPRGFIALRQEAAEERLAGIWTPDIRIANLIGEPRQFEQGLRLFADGRVEWMRRVGGEFATAFSGRQFPFDRQQLVVELISRRDPLDQVAIEFGQAELDESQRGKVEAEGWEIGIVELRRVPLPGWYRQQHARLLASLSIRRDPSIALTVLYVPLFASLLIPLLALWLNRSDDGEFRVEAFELANIMIGGLFAVVALNFTFNSEHPWLAGGDNTVSQLFGLNYLGLAVCLAVTIVLFRFDLARRVVGRDFQHVLYGYLVWAIPLLVLIASAAVLLSAMW